MGMSKTTVSFFLPIFFATIVICAIVLCTCAYCYRPSYFLGIRGKADSDYGDDPEKAPVGRVVVVSTETAADHPSDHPHYDPEAEEVEIIEARPDHDHGHGHGHLHGEQINIVNAHRASSVD